MNLQHDIPVQSIRGRRARISAVDPDNPHNVWVAFRGERGAPEPAYYPSNTTPVVGKDVRVTAEPELKRWKVEDYTSAQEADTTITLNKIWQLNNTSDTHNHIAMHPTQPWIATVRQPTATLEIYNWQTEALIDNIVITGDPNVNDVKWSPLGNYLALAVSASPYILVYPVDPDTGTISAAVSNPASLPPGQGDTVVWHPRQTAIYINYEGGGTNFVSGWPFTTGFGTRFTAPSDAQGWGAGNPGAAIWVDVAAYTRETAINDLWGLAITPDGSALVMRCGDGAWAWLLQLNLDGNGTFAKRYDSMYKLTYDEETSGPSPAWPEFDSTGTIILWGNINGNGATLDNRGTLAYVCDFTRFGFGHLNGAPYPDDIILNDGGIVFDRSRGPKWRPGYDQVVVPFDVDSTSTDAMLALYTMHGARFGAHIIWAPDDSDTWDINNASSSLSNGYVRVAWTPDGKHLLIGLGNTTLESLTDAIAVFDVV